MPLKVALKLLVNYLPGCSLFERSFVLLFKFSVQSVAQQIVTV